LAAWFGIFLGWRIIATLCDRNRWIIPVLCMLVGIWLLMLNVWTLAGLILLVAGCTLVLREALRGEQNVYTA
jgi:membrane-bound ClpP family serine protease